jgi:hypothetical protein
MNGTSTARDRGRRRTPAGPARTIYIRNAWTLAAESAARRHLAVNRRSKCAILADLPRLACRHSLGKLCAVAGGNYLLTGQIVPRIGAVFAASPYPLAPSP